MFQKIKAIFAKVFLPKITFLKALFTASRKKTFAIAGVVATVFLYFTMTSTIEISSLGIGLFRYIAVVIVTWIVQEFGFPEIDTVKIFKDLPYAYIAFVIAHLIVAALCFSIT